jgi:dipeptidyl aminopeptidase/acylaminoacyl peptidase
MRPLVPLAIAATSFLLACAGAPPSPTAPASTPAPVVKAPPSAVSRPAPEATSAPTELTAAQIARDAELVPKATAFLAAFSNSGAHLTRSGAVLFTSNRDGISQLYVGDIAHPKDAPRHLVTARERVGGAKLTPDEKTVLFVSDTNADGNFHIFQIGLDGTKLVDLTPTEKMHRDAPVVARDKGGLFAYSAHAPSSEKTSLYLQSLDGTPAREIYTDARGGELIDLSSDGTRALFGRENADQDTVVFEIETGSGKATRVYPPEGGPKTSVTAAYSAASDRIFVAFQLEGQHAQLLSLDRRTAKPTATYDETLLPNGAIGDLLVSPTGDWISITVNGGNHSEVRILDARTLKLRRTLTTPLGAAFATAVTKDGKRFTIAESHPDAPMDIYLVDAAAGKVTPLRDDMRPGLGEMPPLAASIETIPAFDGLAIPTNVYLPSAKAAPAPTKLPTLVSIHGGPSGSAFVRWSGATRYYSSLGYAIVEPNIRGSVGFGVAYQKADDREKRGDALKDVEAVNKWARAQPWCDPDRLVIMGGSYGGYMTLLAVARQPSLWHAGLDVSGMSDLRTMEKLEDQGIRVYDETEFGILGKEDELLFEWSPLKYVDAIVAPVFVYQGVADPITPQNEADQIVKALRTRNVPVEYMLLANEGHGLTRRENDAEYLARTARFLEEHAASH